MLESPRSSASRTARSPSSSSRDRAWYSRGDLMSLRRPFHFLCLELSSRVWALEVVLLFLERLELGVELPELGAMNLELVFELFHLPGGNSVAPRWISRAPESICCSSYRAISISRTIRSPGGWRPLAGGQAGPKNSKSAPSAREGHTFEGSVRVVGTAAGVRFRSVEEDLMQSSRIQVGTGLANRADLRPPSLGPPGFEPGTDRL